MNEIDESQIPAVQVVTGLLLIQRYTEGKREVFVFMARRPQGKPLPGLWETPGGKVEKGESEEFALIREWLEELDVAISVVNKKLRSTMFESNPAMDYKKFEMHYYQVCIAFDNHFLFKLQHHDSCGWFSMDELSKMSLEGKLAPASMQIREIVNSIPARRLSKRQLALFNMLFLFTFWRTNGKTRTQNRRTRTSSTTCILLPNNRRHGNN